MDTRARPRGATRAGACLDDATTVEVVLGSTVLVPLGATEQHGPHLPLSTDTTIAAAVCRRACELLADEAPELPVVQAPALPYGASGEHEGFAGTMSIGTSALHLLVVELVRSLRRWAGPVVLVSGHGGNAEALASAVGLLRDEGHEVTWTTCAEPGWDAHAGRAETSLTLALLPDAVREGQARAGRTEPVRELLPQLRAHGVAAVSPNGVLGDPAGADEDEGRQHLERVAARVAAQVRSGTSTTQGRLRRPVAAVPETVR